MSAETVVPTAETVVAPAGPRRTLVWLRVFAVLHSLCAIGQPMFAGMYLDGDVDALTIHEINGSAVAALGVAQLVASIVYVWGGHGRRWPMWSSLGLVLVEEVQSGLGYEGAVAIHIPLGVSFIAMQILLTVWLFRDSARVARPPRERAS
ncbi:MAG TPA: hypothetical protein VNP92_12045 [Actinophytocola sp.]|nr:hypothetical protein [Actinophytocola sp.]